MDSGRLHFRRQTESGSYYQTSLHANPESEETQIYSFEAINEFYHSRSEAWKEERHNEEMATGLESARKAELAGRYEDAAEIYESLEMYKEAGDARRKDKTTTVREVSVDLNSLLKQLGVSGMVTVYKCPQCHGNIKISGSTSESSLQQCQFCGNAIQVQNVANFLQDVLK